METLSANIASRAKTGGELSYRLPELYRTMTFQHAAVFATYNSILSLQQVYFTNKLNNGFIRC